MAHDLHQAAENDDLSHSIDYSSVLSSLASSCAAPSSSLEVLSERICDTCFTSYPELGELYVSISRPKALLHARATRIVSEWRRSHHDPVHEKFFIEELDCQAIVGVNPCEREEKQRVRFNIMLDRHKRRAQFDFHEVARKVFENVQSSSHLTLEALASLTARTVLLHTGTISDRVTVRAAKPSALVLAEAAEVEITRTLRDYEPSSASTLKQTHENNVTHAPASPTPSLFSLLAALPERSGHDETVYAHRAAIALGANLGDRFANIELALRLLEMPDGTGRPRAAVVDTSFLYETAPMYVTDQPQFINGACMIETDMNPRSLLAFLKDIEATVGRVSSFRNGPRAIDLDILTFDAMTVDTRPESKKDKLDNLTGELVVPHPRIAEREFVLRPLSDMIPDYVHPVLGKPVRTLLLELVAKQSTDTPAMSKVVPFPRYPYISPSIATVTPGIPSVPPTATYWTFPVYSSTSSRRPLQKSYVMGTLNATPDSFSDGSRHNTTPAAVAYATASVAGGADIIDVGGYSTRPGAAYVSPDEEISRVIPVVEAIRGLSSEQNTVSADARLSARTADVPISVDTFRWEVADAAVRAGASCINDVYAFTGPAYPLDMSAAEYFLKFREIARELAVPVVLMHSRGDAASNKDYSAYSYAADSRGRGAVLEGVRVELGEKVEAAVRGRGGLRRWLVIVDPGVGFSKTLEGNLEVLRASSEITAAHPHRRNPLAGFPQLIGTSRKSFLGTILAQPDTGGAYEGRKTRPDERGWATAAAVSCAVQQGAEVIRVHDVLEMGDAIRVAQALWN
ncbi:Folic acid synthesis protein [Sparassis crispa]|uniref:Folic acid synthesis protein n=1 Tax=Sparassis crispa TaxID=139825 RepID=A0A401GNT2_9APHY|nr:Folic acid synthesis protein [Sparassis crispa]GBE83404.1 Folic acid synthesis protein [Sparassis crispa]